MSNVDIHSRYVAALRTQAKTAEAATTDAWPCPYCSHHGRIFQTADQLFSHATVEHAPVVQAMDPAQARAQVREAALKL